jgi:hypothetical protein
MLESVRPRWQSCIVAAPGPSLFPVHEHPIIVVQDAWKMLPWADVLYGCEPTWWNVHRGTEFQGEKWSTHDTDTNDKTEAHEKWGVRCVRGVHANTFSFSPELIHYGNNSGFQAVNLALLFGCVHIILIGFDMRVVGGLKHFFGDHPKGLSNAAPYDVFAKTFAVAAKELEGVRIVNATPNSGLTCFPMMSFDEAIDDRNLYLEARSGLEGRRRDVCEGGVQGSLTVV